MGHEGERVTVCHGLCGSYRGLEPWEEGGEVGHEVPGIGDHAAHVARNEGGLTLQVGGAVTQPALDNGDQQRQGRGVHLQGAEGVFFSGARDETLDELYL